MSREWNDRQPIYRQLRERVIALILDDALRDGDALPSVRSVAAEYRLNPLTVMKAYQRLVDDRIVEKRRGIGLYVRLGAREILLAGERERFLREEWPRIAAAIRRLGFSFDELRALDPQPAEAGEAGVPAQR